MSKEYNPKIKYITNEFNKEIKFTEDSLELHTAEDKSFLTLKEKEGMEVSSDLSITILSCEADIILESEKITIQSEDKIAVTGAASSVLLDNGTVHFKAPLVNKK